MIKVIGVRFRTAGKIYFFDPLQFTIERGDHVIVETARGIEYGTVVSGITEVEEDKVVQPLKPVIRLANQRDMEQEAGNKDKEKEAFQICLEKIQKHGLEMKLIDAEYTFDNNKVLFYFTADGRIDFRELVKDLASVFKTRIELRQIGVRDETKIVGGIGICGRPLCCHSYLSDFVPVSIKMAKEQNLSLNPTKISGVCGRLMCCLKNEEETYEELNRRLPGIGDHVTTEDGLKGEVQSVNVLRQLVKVVVDIGDEKEIREYEVNRLSFKRRHGRKENVELSKEELKELERLEEEEAQEVQENEGRHDNGQSRNGFRQDRQREETHPENGQSRNGFRQDRQREETHPENGQPRNGFRQDRQREETHPENGQPRNGFRQDRQREETHPENGQSRNGFRQDRQREETHPENGQSHNGFRQGRQGEDLYSENDRYGSGQRQEEQGQDNVRYNGYDSQGRSGQNHQDNRQRQYNRQRQDHHRQDGQYQENYQRRDYHEGQHREGQNRQDNRQRQYNRQRQDSHRQDVQRQEGYQRRDYKPRYRHDTRPRQEGRAGQNDGQS